MGMTSFQDADTDGSGSIDKSEWDALALEDRRRKLEDEDAHRDQTRKMAWFSLWGMLLYPFGVVLTGALGLDNASSIIGSMASIYFVSVAGVVSVFMGVASLAKRKDS
jgi:hypothetical protein|tara:strand:- start:236 stop:559 length:324 start_codon:yes stop_codon:yes gene_type:complete